MHLRPGQTVVSASVDGVYLRLDRESDDITMLAPMPIEKDAIGGFAPFGGKGSRPAPLAGHIAEIRLPSSPGPRVVEVTIA